MSSGVKSRFLDRRGLAALEQLRFTTKKRIEGTYSGRHRSRSKGGAGEFVDYREYSDGEDIRRLDWKVLARSGRAYVRLYQEETNLRCMLALDASQSMNFRGGHQPSLSKLEYVQFFATALSHVIARGQDQVGLAWLGEQLLDFIPPGGTSAHLARVHAAIESPVLYRGTRMAPSLHALFARVERRGVLVLASDFLIDDLDEVFAAVRLFRHRQWELLVLHVVDPAEERLPEGTAYNFIGLEGEGSIACSPAEIRAQYDQRFAAHLSLVRGQALAAGCDYHRVSTAVNYLQLLRGFLVERAG